MLLYHRGLGIAPLHFIYLYCMLNQKLILVHWLWSVGILIFFLTLWCTVYAFHLFIITCRTHLAYSTGCENWFTDFESSAYSHLKKKDFCDTYNYFFQLLTFLISWQAFPWTLFTRAAPGISASSLCNWSNYVCDKVTTRK